MSGERNGQPSMAGLAIKTSTSSFNPDGSKRGRLSDDAKKKSLDVTLDNLVV